MNSHPATSQPSRQEIDRMLGRTPCICGDLHEWHGRCYLGKTEKQVDAAYERVYANVRKRMKNEGWL